MTIPAVIRLWFAADCALALLVPLRWPAAPDLRIGGLPIAIAYLFGTSLFVTASILCAYRFDGTRGR